MNRRGTLARLLAAMLLVSVAAPQTVGAATKKKKPTAAQRAAAKREAERRKAAELERQRQALSKAWQADKGCYQAGSAFGEPRLKDDDPIEIPQQAKGGALKAALLMYEAKVDKYGHLNSLRTLRPLPKDPPWPALHQAVVHSVSEWRWDRTKVAGKTIPVCFPLTLNLDLR